MCLLLSDLFRILCPILNILYHALSISARMSRGLKVTCRGGVAMSGFEGAGSVIAGSASRRQQGANAGSSRFLNVRFLNVSFLVARILLGVNIVLDVLLEILFCLRNVHVGLLDVMFRDLMLFLHNSLRLDHTSLNRRQHQNQDSQRQCYISSHVNLIEQNQPWNVSMAARLPIISSSTQSAA